MSKIEELEKKIEERREAREKAEEAQYEIDLAARLDLEEEFGKVSEIRVTSYREGFPTRAYVRTPRAVEYKRYKDILHRAHAAKNTKQVQDAGDQLARACWVYPAQSSDGGESPEQKAMLDAFPGLLVSINIVAAKLAEGRMGEEGKD
ncbi:MAG: hypothetical protein FWD73_06915 [Polyangiaceae bacterium]|nr:hypothetical protein [Polyangiaceae bacterium]